MNKVNKIQLSLKQELTFRLFGNRQYKQILYGGATGGGKTFLLMYIMIYACINYPGIRVGYARQTLKSIKANSMPSFYEVIKLLGLDNEYKYNSITGEIKFNNGSEIIFTELAYRPQDPLYDRFGGLLLTFACIEEAAGVDERSIGPYFIRCNKWMNQKYNLPGQLFMTTNPGLNFVYKDFYNPFIKGELEPHKCFIPAFLTDNKYIPEDYEESLRTVLDDKLVDRMVEGDWSFSDDDTRLADFNSINRLFDITEDEYKDIEKLNYTHVTSDIAFTSDKCVFIVWKENYAVHIINYKGDEPDKELERIMKEYNIKQKYVAYDSDGVGKYLKKFKQAIGIVGNSKALNKENYANLRSQLYYNLRYAIQDTTIKIVDDKYKNEIIQEIYATRTTERAGKMAIIPKDDIKTQLGRSPDFADALAYRMIFNYKLVADYKPTYGGQLPGRFKF